MASIPTATYRLQINKGFTLDHARELVSYFRDLGISHLYCSPIFQAPEESTHGYDLWDHNRIGTHVGGNQAFEQLQRAASSQKLGIILDFVPNHMGITGNGNKWWWNVLENGRQSPYGSFFDIDWEHEPKSRVIIPTLGDLYGNVLRKGELKLSFTGGKFTVAYYANEFPLSMRSIRQILEKAGETLPASDRSVLQQWLSTTSGVTNAMISEMETSDLLARLFDKMPALTGAVANAIDRINATAAHDGAKNELHEILEMQSYRLTFWRSGSREINYRRFFEVNGLAALRMEDPKVFEAAHQLLRELIGTGKIQGVRIDHVDGLADPIGYLEGLQVLAKESGASLDKADPKPLYLLVEKILTLDEPMPETWPIHGTTGYEFASQVLGLLVDGDAESHLSRAYDEFTGVHSSFPALVYEKKKMVLELSFHREVRMLADQLFQIAQHHLSYRDLSHDVIQLALVEFICRLPVYRTYVSPERGASNHDQKTVEETIGKVKQTLPGFYHAAVHYLGDVFLLRWPDVNGDEVSAMARHFLKRFQQFTGAVTAKGVEDTSLFLYHRLDCLNEVGSFPERFCNSPERFHKQNQERLQTWPHSMLATSTHDTKVSEDVRARMAVISELNSQWVASVRLWRDLNQKHKKMVGGRFCPDANEEYLLYQILLGTYPLEAQTESERKEYISRLQAYFQKATREGKTNSSWIEPNNEWEEAQARFIEQLLQAGPDNVFLELFVPFAQQIAQFGAINSLSQSVLKLTVPGVPDIYQGNEIWNFSLVDPDNRRPVDYALRQKLMRQNQNASAPQLMEEWKTGAIKLFVFQKLLQLRSRAPELFAQGGYEPIQITGSLLNCCFGFWRTWRDQSVLVLVPRLATKVGFPSLGARWKDTVASLDRPVIEGGMRHLFTGAVLNGGIKELPLAEAFSVFPAAVYSNVL